MARIIPTDQQFIRECDAIPLAECVERGNRNVRSGLAEGCSGCPPWEGLKVRDAQSASPATPTTGETENG